MVMPSKKICSGFLSDVGSRDGHFAPDWIVTVFTVGEEIRRESNHVPAEVTSLECLATAFRASFGTSYSLNSRSYLVNKPIFTTWISALRSIISADRGKGTAYPNEEVHHHFLHDTHIVLHRTSLLSLLSDPP